jgi:hypothetical protein
MAEDCKSENADRIVANVVPFDGHSVLPVLEKLDSEAKEERCCSRPPRTTAVIVESYDSEEGQRTETQEMCDMVGYAEMKMRRPHRLQGSDEQSNGPGDRSDSIRGYPRMSRNRIPLNISYRFR